MRSHSVPVSMTNLIVMLFMYGLVIYRILTLGMGREGLLFIYIGVLKSRLLASGAMQHLNGLSDEYSGEPTVPSCVQKSIQQLEEH